MKKRTVAIMLLAAMVLGGCSAKTENVTESTGSDTATETVETAETSTDSAEAENTETETSEFGPDSEDWPTLTIAMSVGELDNYQDGNYAFDYFEESVGANIEVVALPADSADAETKLNLMLANGDYPDVISYNLNKARMIELGEEGIFVPLNDLYEQYGDNLKTAFESAPEYYSNSIAPDGNMYGLPSINECYHCSAYPKFWYNREWLESLGMDIPTTTDELKEVLIAAKNSDFNGNGEADEIPLSGAIDLQNRLVYFLGNYFLPIDETSLCYAEDGKVVFGADKEEFKMALEWIKELYDEGLIDPASFSQDSSQQSQTYKADNKRIFAFVNLHHAMVTELTDDYSNSIIACMPPVESPTGARYQPQFGYVDQASNFGYFITDKCQNPEIAFKLADFFVSDESYLIGSFGKEGIYWGRRDEAFESSVPGVDTIYWCEQVTDTTKTDFFSNRFNLSHGFATVEQRARTIETPVDEDTKYTTAGFEWRLRVATDAVAPYFYEEYLIESPYIGDADKRESFNSIRTSLQEYVNTAAAQFVTGELSLEKDWDAYVSTIQDYGVDEYLEIYQEVFDQYNANLK